MTENPNPWLPVVQRLAREVDVAEYIYGADQRNVDRLDPPGAWWRRALRYLMGASAGALLAWAVSYATGYRLVGPEQQRLIEAVYRVDPRPERWTDRDLTERLGIRAEAMNLLEHAVAASPGSDLYPYVAELTGHPPPLIEPGRGPALLLLANAIDGFSKEQRGMLVDRIVTVAAALGEPDVQVALSGIASLDQTTRRTLFVNGAAGLKRLMDLQASLDQAAATQQTLVQKLDQQNRSIRDKSADMETMIAATQRWLTDLGHIDQQCRHASDGLAVCMSIARQKSQR